MQFLRVRLRLRRLHTKTGNITEGARKFGNLSTVYRIKRCDASLLITKKMNTEEAKTLRSVYEPAIELISRAVDKFDETVDDDGFDGYDAFKIDGRITFVFEDITLHVDFCSDTCNGSDIDWRDITVVHEGVTYFLSDWYPYIRIEDNKRGLSCYYQYKNVVSIIHHN